MMMSKTWQHLKKFQFRRKYLGQIMWHCPKSSGGEILISIPNNLKRNELEAIKKFIEAVIYARS